MKDLNPTERFTTRVSDYVLYRPSYPSTLLDYLDERVGGFAKANVADVGAGTGIFTRLLLERDASVIAVEPNEKMRDICARDLRGHARLKTQGGTAEETGIAEHSIDLITCAQAFHWFDPKPTRKEFSRILKPNGLIALIWNDVDQSTGLGEAFEAARKTFGGEEYARVSATNEKLDAVFEKFFYEGSYETKFFEIHQDLDEAGLLGRFFSSSYAPASDSPLKPKATAFLRETFARFEKQGRVRLEYKTELYLGK